MILVDTHAWLWHASGDRRLSAAAREAIGSADAVGVSPVSCFEVATLVRLGRVELDRPARTWIAQALAQPAVVLVELTPEVAAAAGSLPADFPGDPADRLLYATAAAARARLVTKDRALRAWDPTLTVW